jgi:hypothetical protein
VGITRELEHERLSYEADREEGIDRSPRTPDREREQRIDVLRAVRGMPPREHERSSGHVMEVDDWLR